MKEKIQILFLLMLVFSLAGCSQWAVTPSMTLTRLTPEAETFDDQQKAALVSDLVPATARVLEIYPLWPGSLWEYKFLGFDETNEYIWHVSEKVIEAKVIEGYYLAKLERTADCVEGDPPDDFLNQPETGIFWYLIDGDHLYFFEGDYDLDLSNAWLDLIIPFPNANQVWYPQPDLRGNIESRQSGYRQASVPYQEVLATGQTVTCYNVSTSVEDGKEERTFCETIGFLFKEKMSFLQVFGYQVELVGFSVE